MTGWLKQISREIRTELRKALEKNDSRIINPDWITTAVCNKHKNGLRPGNDGDFWKQAGHGYIRNKVREAIRGIDDPISAKNSVRAPRLPGFKHLQAAYSITRDDEFVAVPIDDLSYEERQDKGDWLIAVGGTTIEHGEELKKYEPKQKELAV